MVIVWGMLPQGTAGGDTSLSSLRQGAAKERHREKGFGGIGWQLFSLEVYLFS